jgi:anti-sigma factor RsiW
MQCESVQPRLEDYLDGQASLLERQAIEAHVGECRSCSRHIEAERALRQQLADYQPPEPPPGFADRVLASAGHRARRRFWQRMGVGAAAAVLTVVLAGSFLMPHPDPVQRITVAKGEPEKVNLVFEARRAMEDVRISLRIPEGVQIQGYGDRRSLDWRTDLRAGRNQLTLPVIVHSPGALRARLQHEEGGKEFGVRLEPRGGQQQDPGEPQV